MLRRVLKFILCIRLRPYKFLTLIVLFAGYLVWFGWLVSIRHERPTEAFAADASMVENSLKIEPYTTQKHTVISRDPKTSSFVKHSAGSSAARPSIMCDRECLRFRNILSNWPQDKPKAAVYYLTKAGRLNLLNSSLTSLYHSFLYSFDYPVIIFHEASLRYQIQQMFHNYVAIRIFFQEVQFDIPSHLNASAVEFKIKCLSHIGYRHMCRFHAKQVYEQAILVGLEYVWRLDDDSLLPVPINYDLFAFMQRYHFQYGYIKIHWDSYDCTTGLWEAVKRYQKLWLLESPYFDKWTEPTIFYNNFEISALSLWMSKQYQDYINYIDLLGGIYYHRWGDAPIKSIAVTLFLQEEATHLFTDVTYQHGNFFRNASYSSF